MEQIGSPLTKKNVSSRSLRHVLKYNCDRLEKGTGLRFCNEAPLKLRYRIEVTLEIKPETGSPTRTSSTIIHRSLAPESLAGGGVSIIFSHRFRFVQINGIERGEKQCPYGTESCLPLNLVHLAHNFHY